MQIIKGNLLNVKRGVIVHQCNNKGVMGAGIAKQIRNAYPKHYGDYLSSQMILGDVVITKVSDELFVIGYIGQDGYGRDGKCYTVYSALSKAFMTINKFASIRNLPIYCPYNIGCSLAGGDWELVSHLISKLMPTATLVQL